MSGANPVTPETVGSHSTPTPHVTQVPTQYEIPEQDTDGISMMSEHDENQSNSENEFFDIVPYKDCYNYAQWLRGILW